MVGAQPYLVLDVGAASRELLAALLARGGVPSVLLRAAGGQALTAQTLKPLIELAQSRDAAALVLDDIALARVLRADGVHLSASADVMGRYEEARSTLGARAIVGVDAGGSRHIAMEVAEAGADYVAFGRDQSMAEAAPVEDDGVGDALEAFDQADLIRWWAQVFEVPCVAFDVESAEDAAQMAALGAEFVAVTAPKAAPLSDVTAWFAGMKAAMEGADA